MTPKLKADELIVKFENYVQYDNCTEEPLEYIQIECAKIVFDEILNLPKVIGMGKFSPIIKEDYEFWKEVKQELEKL